MVSKIQHYLNPLHIYCRLRDFGLSQYQATALCKFYEKIFFRLLYLNKTNCWNNINIGKNRDRVENINI
jgi:hypothetical protein